METVHVQTEKALETVTIPQAEYEGLRIELKELKAQNQWLLEQLRVIRQKKFGTSSEKASEEVIEQLSLLFDEAEVYVAEESKEETPAVEVHSHTRRKGGDVRSIVPENIEVVETEHTLSEEERTCPQCGETMQAIGKEVRETLELIPAKAVLHRDIYYTYACKNCEKMTSQHPL